MRETSRGRYRVLNLPCSFASVRPSASFLAVHALDAVGWTNNNNDQDGGGAVKKPSGWQSM
jgi:hypothetical protein